MMKTPLPPLEAVLPSQEFDQGTKTAAPHVLACMKAFQAELQQYGVDVKSLAQQAKTVSLAAAPALLSQLHDTAVILFTQWQLARQKREEGEALAWARLVNEVTHSARQLNQRHGLIPTEHIQELAASVQRDQAHFSPEGLAQKLGKAAVAHTHERAWPWVVLPTFPRQPYGRILLAKTEVGEDSLPVFITQPFFLSGKCTLFHTHGQNWAMSRPLGGGADKNTHINTLWLPGERERPFPLVQTDFAEYSHDDVVIIPPRLIHGIAKKRGNPAPLPTLVEIFSDAARKAELIAQSRFGECSCLHMYYPCTALARELAHSPLVQEDERFFIEYDMIVFDHYEASIWSGGGGSWPRRMITFGATGEHCGICFEDDPRRENLAPSMVWDWLVGQQPQEIFKFTQQPTMG